MTTRFHATCYEPHEISLDSPPGCICVVEEKGFPAQLVCVGALRGGDICTRRAILFPEGMWMYVTSRLDNHPSSEWMRPQDFALAQCSTTRQPVMLVRVGNPLLSLNKPGCTSNLIYIPMGPDGASRMVNSIAIGPVVATNCLGDSPAFLCPSRGGFSVIPVSNPDEPINVKCLGMSKDEDINCGCLVHVPGTPYVLLGSHADTTIYIFRRRGTGTTSSHSKKAALPSASKTRLGWHFDQVGSIDIFNALETTLASPYVILQASSSEYLPYGVLSMDVDPSGSRLAVAYGGMQVVVPLASILGDERFTIPTDDEWAARCKNVSDTLNEKIAKLQADYTTSVAGYRRLQAECEDLDPEECAAKMESAAAVKLPLTKEETQNIEAIGLLVHQAASRAMPCIRLWGCKTQFASSQAVIRGFVPAMVLEGVDSSSVMSPTETITGPCENHVVRFSPAGDRLAMAVRSGTVSIHDARTGRMQTIVSTPYTSSESIIESIYWLPIVQGAGLLIKTELGLLTVVEIPSQPTLPPPTAATTVATATAATTGARKRGTWGVRETGVSGWLNSRSIGLGSRRSPNKCVTSSIRRRSRGPVALRKTAGFPITDVVSHRDNPKSDQDCKHKWWAFIEYLCDCRYDMESHSDQGLFDFAEHDMWDGLDSTHRGAPPQEWPRTEESDLVRVEVGGDGQAWQDQTEAELAVDGCTASLGAITQQAYVCETCLLRSQGGAAVIRAAEAHGWLSLEASRLLLSLSSGVGLDLCKPKPLTASVASRTAGATDSTSDPDVQTNDVRIKRLLHMQLPPTGIVPITLCGHCAKSCHADRGHNVRALGRLDKWTCECASFRAETMLENCPYHRIEVQQYGPGCGGAKCKTAEPSAEVISEFESRFKGKGMPFGRLTGRETVIAPRCTMATTAQLERIGIKPDSIAWAIARGKSSLEWAKHEAHIRGLEISDDVGHDHRSFGVWCRCLTQEEGDMLQCVGCQDWFHSACLNDIGPRAVLEVNNPLPIPDSDDDLALVDEDGGDVICSSCVRLYLPGFIKNWEPTDVGHQELDDALEKLLGDDEDAHQSKRPRELNKLLVADETKAAGPPSKRSASQQADDDDDDDDDDEQADDDASDIAAAAAASSGPDVAAESGEDLTMLARKLVELTHCDSSMKEVLLIRQYSRKIQAGPDAAEYRVCRGAIQVIAGDGDARRACDWLQTMKVMSATSNAVASGQVDLLQSLSDQHCLVPSRTYSEAAVIQSASWRLCGLFDHEVLHKRMHNGRPPAWFAQFGLPAKKQPVVLAALPHSDSVKAMNSAIAKLKAFQHRDYAETYLLFA